MSLKFLKKTILEVAKVIAAVKSEGVQVDWIDREIDEDPQS